MEKLLISRLQAIASEKIKNKKRLKELNPNFNLNHDLLEKFYIKFNKASFTKEEKIEVIDHSRGIIINTTLADDEYKYIYFLNKKLISQIKEYLERNAVNKLQTTFPGYVLGNINVEFFLTFILEDDKRIVEKIAVGDCSNIDISYIDNVKEIKISIRLKGSGKVYLHHSYINSLLISRYSQEKTFTIKEVKKTKDLNVIFIADEFTTRCFEPEFKLIKILSEKWEEELLNQIPDLFFCESAWLGNGGSWTNKVGTGGPRNNSRLLEVIRWCNERNIPTIFWNKEDPFHFNAFKETAKHFDFVFTTDENSLPSYNSIGCKNVFVLPFAAQPKIHNPIEKFERKNKVVFAGAYYGDKYPERTKAMDNMMEICGNHGIDIFDRNYDNPNSPNQFPEKFKKYISGTLKDDEIELAYKGYKVALNVNSIIDSPTMFARRVFELLASNTPVVSSEALGIERMFDDLVIASSDYNKLKGRIELYFNDNHYYRKNRLQSLRTVLNKHTYKNRIEKMFATINFPFIKDKQTVTVVAIVRSYEDYQNLMEQFKRQALEHKKLVILLDIFDGYLEIFNKNNTDTIKTYLIDYLHHYKTINDIIETEYYAPFLLKNYYGDNYLLDMSLTTSYTEETIVVKQLGQEYTYVQNGYLDRSLIPKESTKLLKPIQFISLLENQESIGDWFKYGCRFFNIDDFNLFTNYDSKKDINNEKLKKVCI